VGCITALSIIFPDVVFKQSRGLALAPLLEKPKLIEVLEFGQVCKMDISLGKYPCVTLEK